MTPAPQQGTCVQPRLQLSCTLPSAEPPLGPALARATVEARAPFWVPPRAQPPPKSARGLDTRGPGRAGCGAPRGRMDGHCRSRHHPRGRAAAHRVLVLVGPGAQRQPQQEQRRGGRAQQLGQLHAAPRRAFPAARPQTPAPPAPPPLCLARPGPAPRRCRR